MSTPIFPDRLVDPNMERLLQAMRSIQVIDAPRQDQDEAAQNVAPPPATSSMRPASDQGVRRDGRNEYNRPSTQPGGINSPVHPDPERPRFRTSANAQGQALQYFLKLALTKNAAASSTVAIGTAPVAASRRKSIQTTNAVGSTDTAPSGRLPS
jgi:hypothetical protein